MSHSKQEPEVALEDIKIKADTLIRSINDIRFSDENIAVNEREYLLKVPGVGFFYARDGNTIEYSAEKGADPQWVQLYLNNQVLVALLHQRKIISFHASSFILGGRGVMILGETGAGKTSLTVAFTINGAEFLSDDLSPVVFREKVPYIWSLTRKVKLRQDSVEQLKLDEGNLSEAESGTGKKYLGIRKASEENHKLDIIVKIETVDVNEPVFVNLSPSDRFSLLRSEVCSWEILAGMPETEAAYLQQLVQILEQVHFVKVLRPSRITIARMHAALNQYLGSLQ